VWNELGAEKKKTELEGVKASMLELEKTIQSKFRGSTRELEDFIERFHSEMKVTEVRRNEVSLWISFIRKCLKVLSSYAYIIYESDIFQEDEWLKFQVTQCWWRQQAPPEGQ
jgi:hypothetical protein